MNNVRTKVSIGLLLASAVLFVSATWEGSADVASGRNLQGETYGIATNSFPRNTVVDVTNLENNRSVRVLVVSGQSNAGLLATLSRSAAVSIGMDGGTVHRVRITQPSDDIAFAHIRRGPLPDFNETSDATTASNPSSGIASNPSPGNPNTSAGNPGNPFSEVDHTGYEPYVAEYLAEEPELVAYDEPALEPAIAYTEYPEEEPGFIAYVEEPEPEVVAEYPTEEPGTALVAGGVPPNGTLLAATPPAETAYEPRPAPTTVMHEPRIYIPDFRFTLIPTEERLPPVIREHVIPSEYIIPPVAPEAIPDPVEEVPPAPVIPAPIPIHDTPPVMVFIPPPEAPPIMPHVPGFRAISDLERDMWYIQLGAFRYSCSVEEEISRIGTVHPYPVLVQNIGTDSDPMFRLLLGPLNQGESAAVLRRVRSVGNTQAFVRQAR